LLIYPGLPGAGGRALGENIRGVAVCAAGRRGWGPAGRGAPI